MGSIRAGLARRPGPTVRELARAARVGRNLRAYFHDPIDAADAAGLVRSRWQERGPAFLDVVDQQIWSVPTSPYRALLRHAGIGRGDLADLVERRGVEDALGELRDAGVYVSYEEFRGGAEARRGSACFSFRKRDFANPRVLPDYWGSSSGTATRGVPVGLSFAYLRRSAASVAMQLAMWDAIGVPTAVWLPVMPSSAGFNNVLRLALLGPVERWFSHVDPRERRMVDPRRRLNQLLMSPFARLVGGDIPVPEHVPGSDPTVIVDWCRDALRRRGRAFLLSYPSSAVRLASAAEAAGRPLDGLVVGLVGEPVSAAKLTAIRSAGASPADLYAFVQLGPVGLSCRSCADGELHVLEHDAAVIDRPRANADGSEVRALLWTGLTLEAPTVLLNVENDDHAQLTVDSPPCTCALGAVGVRHRLSRIRGISKVVSGGVTIRGGVFEELVEVVLPRACGGHPTDFQFAEDERGGESVVVVRVDPRLGQLDEGHVLEAVATALRRTDPGLLAHEVWLPAGALQVERTQPRPSRSGKLLPFDVRQA